MFLKDCASYVSDRIEANKLSSSTYISTDNMLPERRGIEPSICVPITGKVTAFAPGDILLSNIRPYFKKIWIADRVGGCCADVLVIRADKTKILPEQLFLILSQDSFFEYVMAGTKGSKMPRGDKDRIMNYPIPEVNHIDIISKWNMDIRLKIETNNAIISELEAMAKDIYDYWFVQFDFPDENGKPYKSSGGKMVWNEELKREIPEGWNNGTINTLANLSSVQIKPRSGVIYEHYSIPAYDEGRYPSFEDGSLIASNKFVVKDNMILVSKLNPQFPRIWLPLVMTESSICSTEMLPLIPKKREYIPYLYLFMLSKNTTKSMMSKSTCSTGSRKRIDPDVLMDIAITVPPRGVFSKFSETILPMLEKVKVAIKENSELTSLREFLLPLLMNGQVNVGDMGA